MNRLHQTDGAQTKLDTLSFTKEHKHFPVSLLRVYPTEIGLISGGKPSLNLLFKSSELPPARNLATNNGPLPAARRLTISLKDEPMEIGRGICAASIRCCTLRPEGPAAVPFGKEKRMGRILKSGPRKSGVLGTSRGVGRGELGCFNLSSSHVALLRGASPSDKSILQAFPFKLIFAKDITECDT